MKLTQRERFLAKVAPDPVSGCWMWQGAGSPSGYGIASSNRKRISAHRLAWKLFKGEIKPGIFICHKCDVRACVNPDHLFPGTPADNSQDMKQKIRHRRGEQHPLSKLTEDRVARIKALLAEDKLSLSEIAREFGVATSAIFSIKKGRAWRHVSTPAVALAVAEVPEDTELSGDTEVLEETENFTE